MAEDDDSIVGKLMVTLFLNRGVQSDVILLHNSIGLTRHVHSADFFTVA